MEAVERRWGVWRLVRDVLLFGAGLGGVAHETLFTGGDRPTLLLLFAAMLGLPLVLRGDEGRRD